MSKIKDILIELEDLHKEIEDLQNTHRDIMRMLYEVIDSSRSNKLSEPHPQGRHEPQSSIDLNANPHGAI